MSNFVSVNFKYYKASQAHGEIGHVMRVFKKNTNAIESLTHENFGSDFNLIDKYDELLKFAKQNTKEKTGRVSQVQNTFLDGVLSFSNEQMLEIKKDPLWKHKMTGHIEALMLDIEAKTGFMPVGWKFHLDEGTKQENGEYKLNHHAQLIFMNHEKATGKAPLREFQKRKDDSIWSEVQTLAGERFEDMGFVRGVSAEDIHRKHLEKEEYIAQKLKKAESRAERLETALDGLSEHAVQLLQAQKKAAAKLTVVSQQLEALETLHTNDEQFDKKFNTLATHVRRVKNNFQALYNNNTSFRSFISSLEVALPTQFNHAKKVLGSVLSFFGSDKPKLEYKQKVKVLKTLVEEISEDGYDPSALVEFKRRLRAAQLGEEPEEKGPKSGPKTKTNKPGS